MIYELDLRDKEGKDGGARTVEAEVLPRISEEIQIDSRYYSVFKVKHLIRDDRKENYLQKSPIVYAKEIIES